MSDSLMPFIPVWLDEANLTHAEFRVFCHLCRRADKQGLAWPSLGSVAEKCGMSRITVCRAIQALCEKNLVVNEGKNFGGTVRYRISGAIVSPEERLAPNSIISDTNERAPIVPLVIHNRSSDDTPIVSPEEQEGITIKVNQRRNTKECAFPDLPFSSEAFRSTWSSWESHRKEIKKKLTPTAVSEQFRALLKMGEERAIIAIQHSIANGWQGIFEPRPEKSKSTSPSLGRTFKASELSI